MKQNYVSARPEKRNETVMIPEIMPPARIEQGQPFGSWSAQKPNGAGVDPFRKGLEFNIKYAPLAIASLVLSVGITLKVGQDFTFGAFFFGVLLFAGYWLLGITENFFDRDSGHVVWAFFGWLVEKERIRANTTVTLAWQENEFRRLESADSQQKLLAELRQSIEERQPQSTMNRLANYEPVLEHPPVSSQALESISSFVVDDLEQPEWSKPPTEKNDGSKALGYLLDFVEDLYNNPEWMNGDGLLAKGVRVPWSQRGTDRSGNRTSDQVKRQMLDALNQIEPPLFVYSEQSKSWKINVETYPDVTDAYTAIEDCRIRTM